MLSLAQNRRGVTPLAFILVLALAITLIFPSHPTYAASKCVGKQSVHVSWTGKMTIYLNSCSVKKIITARDDATGYVTAVGAISSVIKNAGTFGPWTVATASIIWVDIGVIKAITANGKYGISFTVSLIHPGIILPLRNA